MPVKIYIIGGTTVFGVWLSINFSWWFSLIFAASLTWAASELLKERKAARMQAFLDEIEMQKMKSEAQVAQARADLETEAVHRARAQRTLIPQGYIGAQLYRPEHANLYHVWGEIEQKITMPVRVAEETTTVLPPAPGLPGPTDLSWVLGTFRPTPERILLALGPSGPITCSLKGLSHVALASPTGGGKSSIVRLLEAQLAALGVPVVHCDPHFTEFDPETGEDWRPIAQRLAQPPIREPRKIAAFLAQLVTETRRRYDLRSEGKHWGAHLWAVLEELPAVLASLDKEAARQVADDYSMLLREARKVGIYLIAVSQDWLVATIGTDGGEIRANLLTAYFAGGGLATARAILDQHVKLPEDTPLGKGVVLLRNVEAQPAPALGRVPYASNEALYRLLPAQDEENDGLPPVQPLPMKEDFSRSRAEEIPAETAQKPLQSASAKARNEIRDWYEKGFTKPHVIARKMGKASSYADDVRLILQEEGLI